LRLEPKEERASTNERFVIRVEVCRNASRKLWNQLPFPAATFRERITHISVMIETI
jgi:hypothetical protein